MDATEFEDENLRERIQVLDDSNRRLAADVRGLTAALDVLSGLQIEQREMARRQTETADKITLVERDARARALRSQRTINLASGAFALLLAAVSILVYLSLLQHVNQLLSEQAANRSSSCEARNGGIESNIERELELARLETDPRIREVHEDSARELKHSLINCQTLQPRFPDPTLAPTSR